MRDCTVKALYDLSHSLAGCRLAELTFPWEILPEIGDIIIAAGSALGNDYNKTDGNVFIHKTAVVCSNAVIKGPCIIGAGTEIRTGAFIRGNALIGDNCVIGNSCEVKNAIIFDNVQVPHFNYVGDSVLGYKSHMGAGAVTSNVKSDKTNVVIKTKTEKLETNRKKVGAFLGDYVEVGCNSVLNPGAVIGRNSRVYPLSCVRGAVPPNSIYKRGGDIAELKER